MPGLTRLASPLASPALPIILRSISGAGVTGPPPAVPKRALYTRPVQAPRITVATRPLLALAAPRIAPTTQPVLAMAAAPALLALPAPPPGVDVACEVAYASAPVELYHLPLDKGLRVCEVSALAVPP